MCQKMHADLLNFTIMGASAFLSIGLNEAIGGVGEDLASDKVKPAVKPGVAFLGIVGKLATISFLPEQKKAAWSPLAGSALMGGAIGDAVTLLARGSQLLGTKKIASFVGFAGDRVPEVEVDNPQQLRALADAMELAQRGGGSLQGDEETRALPPSPMQAVAAEMAGDVSALDLALVMP